MTFSEPSLALACDKARLPLVRHGEAGIMGLDKIEVVDAVGTEKNSDRVVLNLLMRGIGMMKEVT
jgi:hypothetical protein